MYLIVPKVTNLSFEGRFAQHYVAVLVSLILSDQLQTLGELSLLLLNELSTSSSGVSASIVISISRTVILYQFLHQGRERECESEVFLFTGTTDLYISNHQR